MSNPRAAMVLAATVLGAACTGVIDPTGGQEGPAVGPNGEPVPGSGTALPGAGAPGGGQGQGGGGSVVDPGTPLPWRPGDSLPPPGEDIPVDQKVPAPVDPGGVRLRRLNRIEYNNSVRDLLGTSLRPADDFPDDDVNFGFDTIGSALNTSPLHLELYERAATALVDELYAEPAESERRTRILFCDASADLGCARQVLERFTASAWRRPAAPEEVDRLTALVDLALAEGATQEAGVRLALSGALMSPHFVYRIEADPDPASEAPHRLTDHELATRLSYFLWSTTPDASLRAAADAATLNGDAELGGQVERMLADARSRSLVENFAGQWLFTRSLSKYQPDPGAFPAFDAEIRSAMKEETERFFEAFMTGTAPLHDIITAEYTFVDQKLAAYYGLPAPAGAFDRVSLAGTPRMGLLTQGSFLVVTSTPTRTSPVKRGKWVLDQLLCSPPLPPPPGVEGLSEGAGAVGTLRERLAKHRDEPVCASCHNQMDPIGLGLQNFDGGGAYRAMEDGVAIDATGELPGGATFDGARELAALVSEDTRFDACLTEQLLTYAVGRGFVSAVDRPWIAHLTQEARSRGGTFRDLVATIVTSEAFRSRRALPEEQP